uniref:Transthyretin-like protein n=1 Tax=Panagrolaimus sp. JU765 TaxID=591449 RepID=A0AC34R187_9BILA
MKKIVFLLVVGMIGCTFGQRSQTVGVRGQVMCNGRPMSGVQIKLWDEDTGPDPDDLMAQGTTDMNGRFQLSGTESELTNIDPRLKIYHTCDQGYNPCKRKVTFKIPSQYINSGSQVGQWFDLGTLNLNTKFPDESRECFG